MLIKAFIIFLVSTQLYSKECSPTLTTHGISKDCIKCALDPIPRPANLEKITRPLNNFFTDKNSQVGRVDRYKSFIKFLESNDNQKLCSNYKSLVNLFNKEFQEEISNCEKGPEILDRNKIICEWALNTYNDQMIAAIENQLYEASGTKGLLKYIKGRTLEHMDGPIRTQFNWCLKMKNTYKGKIFVSCGDLENWVNELNLVKRVSESMRRDMAARDSNVDPIEDRKKMSRDACKYFDKNSATTWTRDFYLNCVTR